MALDDFERFDFTHNGQIRPVYRQGRGPGVVILHVLPGIIPEVVGFACRVSSAGFTVYLPHLFGVPEKPLTKSYNYAEFVRVCLRNEFCVFAARKSSPITD